MKTMGFWAFLAAGGLCFAVETTAVLQQDLNGYDGVRDTFISTHDWGTPPQTTLNYGIRDTISLSRNGGDNPLLWFDLSFIPTNSQVVSATLELYNETASSQGYARRIKVFRVLRNWDEGNLDGGQIDTAGEHGATGEYAVFEYGGTQEAWAAVGMEAGTDYVELEEDFADVVGVGWYSWDITGMVNAWVRGEHDNFGMVLRDATGYQDGNPDWREFPSRESTTDPLLRPKLTVTYNPDVPFAHAGSDVATLTWDGSAITLDASASHDRPGGNDLTLEYGWSIVEPAYGSTLSGEIGLYSQNTVSFVPDMPGMWVFRLTLTNEIDESATDEVAFRLLNIPAQHPRIYLDAAKLAQLQARARPDNFRWTQLVAEANDPNGAMLAKALVYTVTDTATYGQAAIDDALDVIADPGGYSTEAGDLALVFDWCYDQLTPGEVNSFVSYFNAWGQEQLDNPFSADVPGWTNYWPRYGYSFAMIGLASFGDNPRAQEWFDTFRIQRFDRYDLDLLDYIAEGGAWPEGMIYDWIANPSRIQAMEAWRTTTGENLFHSTPWFENRLPYFLLHRFPGIAQEWGTEYHPYLSTGDTERNRGSITNYGRIMALMLIERFPDSSAARQLQAYLATPPCNNSDDFQFHHEFLWFDENQAQESPHLLTHLAQGTGTVFMRSGWPDGAADTDTQATYLSFQCGDHFTYHQHYDQNSFTLFKYDDLLLDSGVYSGDGLSSHDRNYYVRTIAHNTLTVYNPDEDFAAARPGAESNDGGQRSMTPGSRSPQTMEHYQQYFHVYDTGDILRFADDTDLTYALGDATKAYNNPTYNQAMDTALTGNVAKLSQFQREFVYLRGVHSAKQITSAEAVVLFDRVTLTEADFSGENTAMNFHFMTEPSVTGTATAVSPGETLYTQADRAECIHGDGKLTLHCLLPEQANIRKVGGNGQKSFWVEYANFDWHWDAGEAQPRPTNDFEDIPYGEWRIQIEPPDESLDVRYLTVLIPSSPSFVAPDAVRVQSGDLTGVNLLDPIVNRVLLFSNLDQANPPEGALTYTLQPSTVGRHVIFDLTPGQLYQLDLDVNDPELTVTLTPSPGGALEVSASGILRFNTPAVEPCLQILQAALTAWPETDVRGLIPLACP